MKILHSLRNTILIAATLLVASIATVPGTSISLVTPAAAQGYQYMSCDQLWYARNAIYANRGYCFKTRRARAVFGSRCYAPWGRLTPPEQRRVDRIVYWERRLGCR